MFPSIKKEKKSVSDECFPLYTSLTNINKKSNDSLPHNYQISFNKDKKRKERSDEMFSFLSNVFTKESKRIHNLNQQKSHANLSPKANQTKKENDLKRSFLIERK